MNMNQDQIPPQSPGGKLVLASSQDFGSGKEAFIPETPRIAGSGLRGRLKSEFTPALIGGAAITGLRIASGEDVPSAIVGGALSTAGSVGGQIVGENAARMAGRQAGKLFTQKVAQAAVGQAGKALAAKAAGTAIGSAIGSVIPGAGTFVGGAIGSLVGGIAGDMMARKLTGGIDRPQIDPNTGEIMLDPNTGQPITEGYSPDASNAIVPGMLSAQQIFDAARERNSRAGMGSIGLSDYGMGV